MHDNLRILVLYFSRHGAVRNLSKQVAFGVESVSGCEALLRTVPEVSQSCEAYTPVVPETGDLYASVDDLQQCAGLIVGSPTRFGTMAAPLKYFFEQTTPEWLSGTLVGKPAGVFTSTSAMHGGQEATLLGMGVPLLHHGMLLVGIPFYQTELSEATHGGTPYGASHISGVGQDENLNPQEIAFARCLGERVAQSAQQLSRTN